MEYDQRVIIRFLLNEKINAHEIVQKLQAQFDEHAYKPRRVRFWITEARFDRQDLHDEICTGKSPLDDLDAKILDILDKSPFEAACLISEILGIAHLTVLLHLHDSIGFNSFHLYWISHLLTNDLRKKRKEYAKAILPFLHAAERDIWYYLMTGEES
jgi:hypothetical protein